VNGKAKKGGEEKKGLFVIDIPMLCALCAKWRKCPKRFAHVLLRFILHVYLILV